MAWGQVPAQIVFQQTFQGIDSFGMLAIPLFMLMGEIMTRTKVVDDLLFLCNICSPPSAGRWPCEHRGLGSFCRRFGFGRSRYGHGGRDTHPGHEKERL